MKPVYSELLALGHGTVDCVSWRPDGLALAVGSSLGITVYTPEFKALAYKHLGSVAWALSWTPDGQALAYTGELFTIHVWNLLTDAELTVLHGHTGRVTHLTWSPDGSQLASASLDSTIRIWDVAHGRTHAVLDGHYQGATVVAWNPNGDRVASGGRDDTIRIWNTATERLLAILEGHEDTVIGIEWSLTGDRLLSTADDRTARIWDVIAYQELSIMDIGELSFSSASWMDNAIRVVGGGLDGIIRVYDLVEGRLLHSFCDPKSPGFTLGVWNSDGTRLCTTSWGNAICIWDIATGQLISSLRQHRAAVMSVDWSPDGTRLAICGYESHSVEPIWIWDVLVGQPEFPLVGAHDVPACSPDGTQIACSSGSTVRIWEAGRGKLSRKLKGYGKLVSPVSWALDGSKLACPSAAGTLPIWDVATGQHIVILNGGTGTITSVAWHPTGDILASG